MRILLTGASSFTGFWFAKTLAEAGHDVTATFTQADYSAYGDGVRGQRVKLIQHLVTPVFSCRFGDARFLATLRATRPDILCHHGAEVSNYKSPDYDAGTALVNNSQNLVEVLRELRENGGGKVLLTGSVFEGGEGAGSDKLPHFSPYGLSKSLTCELFRYYCGREGISLGKFVISNPFGPYEEPRFTAYLTRCWKSDEVPTIRTPDYVRDNIHVSLLARVYCRTMEQLGNDPGFVKFNPSGYVESQGAFARRFAQEMEPRWGRPCMLKLAAQIEFPEPRIRINTDPVDAIAFNWNESAAWDDVAAYCLTAATLTQ